MIKLLIACCAALVGYPAISCPISAQDLTGEVVNLFGADAVRVTQRVDPRSEEPVKRYTVNLSDGDLLMLEQQHCEMRNTRVTLLSSDMLPDPASVASMADLLAVSDTWRDAFAELDAHIVLGAELDRIRERAFGVAAGFYYSVDDEISSSVESSESVLTFMSTDSPAAQFGSVLSLYLGVGGQ